MDGFVLGQLQFRSTSQNIHLTWKTAILAMLAVKKNTTHLHLVSYPDPPLGVLKGGLGMRLTSTQTNQNWAQFQKAQLTPYKTRYAFSRLPPGQGNMYTNLLPVIAPRMELTYTHSRYHKSRRGLLARKVSFLQCLCQTTVWWHPSSRMALCLSSTPWSSKLCGHMTNSTHQPQSVCLQTMLARFEQSVS